jgi:hypothetical protein
MHAMINNHSSFNLLYRGINIALITIAIGLIYVSTLFRRDAWLIIGITVLLYAILKLAKRMISGVSIDKLGRIILFAFILLSLIPASYGIWQWMIHTNVIGN